LKFRAKKKSTNTVDHRSRIAKVVPVAVSNAE
jgi:hypothetical protein